LAEIADQSTDFSNTSPQFPLTDRQMPPDRKSNCSLVEFSRPDNFNEIPIRIGIGNFRTTFPASHLIQHHLTKENSMQKIRVLIPEEQIAGAVADLGQRISDEYRDSPLTILGVLTGSIFLVTDLMREIEIPHELGLVQASSYRGSATRPGTLSINTEYLPEIRDRDVLLVDDIFDTGRTLSAIREKLLELQPRSIRSAVLLWKTDRREVDATPDYHCFKIPDEFVVGYGLDFNNQYRHLPYIGVLEPE